LLLFELDVGRIIIGAETIMSEDRNRSAELNSELHPVPLTHMGQGNPPGDSQTGAVDQPGMGEKKRWWIRRLSARWKVICLVSLLGLIGGGLWGYHDLPRTVSLSFFRNQPVFDRSPAMDPAHPGSGSWYSVQSLADLMTSPELLDQVGTGLDAAVEKQYLWEALEVEPVGDTDEIAVTLSGNRPDIILSLAGRFADTVVSYTREMQARDAREQMALLTRQLDAVNQSLRSANQELSSYQDSGQPGGSGLEKDSLQLVEQLRGLDIKAADSHLELETLKLHMEALTGEILKHHPTLLEARQKLNQALLKYTEEHPTVMTLRATLTNLEASLELRRGDVVDPEIALHGSSLAKNLYSEVIQLRSRTMALQHQLSVLDSHKQQLKAQLEHGTDEQLDYARIQSQYATLAQIRDQWLTRQKEARLLLDETPGYLRIFHPAQLRPLSSREKVEAVVWGGLGGGITGVLLASLVIGFSVRRDRRVRSAEELVDVTGLPILATLGDLEQMDEESRDRWAFETFTNIKGRLTGSGNRSLVCGFVSSRHGEGRSTWVNLLAKAAKKRGYRVLTIKTDGSTLERPASETAEEGESPSSPAESGSLTRVVSSPSELTNSLMASGIQPMLNLQPMDWVWDLECRGQWQQAMKQCRNTDNLVVFVDLPPLSEDESALLSENFSQVIWLCGEDMADMDETKTHVNMLRYSRTDLVGAVMNRSRSKASSSTRTTHANLAASILTVGLLLSGAGYAAQAQAPPTTGAKTVLVNEASTPAPAAQPGVSSAFSITSPAQMAAWQRRLTLGPGDVLDVSMYEVEDSERPGLVVGPDGRLNYLQARDVEVTGLTVEEFRTKMEKLLVKYYRPPLRVIVIPRAFNSKKYYLLGNVQQKGVFPLNRPMTLLEAVAQSGGFVSSAATGDTLLLADLSRSFLMRKTEDNTFS
jgi:protein involved in polysaccharide export with SLBB domain/capsular polysaccharide biosynthesis protein